MSLSLKTLFVFLLFAQISSAQCLVQKVPLHDRIEEANVIVEGKVFDKRSVWNNSRNSIFTLNQVEVFKIFKEHSTQIIDDTIIVVTEGGIIDNEVEVVKPSVQLKIHDIGMFLLKNFRKAKEVSQNSAGRVLYEVVAAQQGFIEYNIAQNTARDVFSLYEQAPG